MAVEGGEIAVRSYVPASSTDDACFPMLFWTHGGGRRYRYVCHCAELRVYITGWVIGDLEMDDYYLKILCVELQIVIVSPDYRLVRSHTPRGSGHVLIFTRRAPEHPFPTGINDAFAALKWVGFNHNYVHTSPLTSSKAKQNAGRFNVDLSKGFLVGGPSAGGNFAAILAHRAKADPEFSQHPLTGQILQYPVTVHPDVVPEEYGDIPLSDISRTH